METYLKMLESYRGRDKILRLCSFAALAGAGTMKGEFARRLLTIAGQIGEARTVLRLFDGLPMLKSILRLGLASTERNQLIRILSVLTTWSIQLFYPCEALAWSGRHKVIPVKNPERWSSLAVLMWLIYLVGSILKSLLKIPGIQRTKAKLKKQSALDPTESRSNQTEQNEVISWSIQQLEFDETTEHLSIMQNFADLLNAVHWLPKGYLWSGKLSLSVSGLLGVLSTAVMIMSSSRSPPKKD